MAAITTVYLFYISAGTWVHFGSYSSFYDSFAEGLRSGHLYLAEVPPPALLAQANPYDPKNQPLWHWDISLYKGHYYIYWGPLPGVLLAGVKAAFRIKSTVGDEYVTFAFFTMSLVCGALLIERLGRRLFDDQPAVLTAAAILAFALGSPTPFMLSRGAVYEAAIVGGQAFLLLGFLPAFGAVSAPAMPASSPLPRAKLAMTGAAWALALACRVSLAPAVLLLAVAVAIAVARAGRPGRRWRDLVRALMWVGVPLAVGMGALLVHNHARFDEWLEFGNHRQLSSLPTRLGLKYVPWNLYSYALRPFQHGCKFPLLTTPWNMANAYPKWLLPPADYVNIEPVAGMLRSTPWSWLAIVAVGVNGWAAWRAWRRDGQGPALDGRARARLWCMASFFIAGTISLAPAVIWYTGTMRYLGDVTPGLLLLSTLGASSLLENAGDGNGPRRVVVGFCLALAAATVVMGLLLGIDGYFTSFKTQNPALFAKMAAHLSTCH